MADGNQFVAVLARRVILWVMAAVVTLPLFAGIFIFGVIQWRKHALRELGPLQRLAKLAGDRGFYSGSEEVVLHQLLSEPSMLVPLLKNEDHGVRLAAIALLQDHATEILFGPGDWLELMVLIRGSSPDDQRQLVQGLTRLGAPAFMALTTLFEDAAPITDSLLRNLRGRFGGEEASEARKRLMTLAFDSGVPAKNRVAAVETIGVSSGRSEEALEWLDKIARTETGLLAKAARIAISRVRNTPDLERLEADMEWYRRHEPYALSFYFREVAALGDAVKALGPEILKELRPLGHHAGNDAAVALAKIDYREAIPQLMEALENKDDWHLVAGAAEALGRLRARESEGALKRLAENAVFPVVRQIAANAILAMSGQYEYSGHRTEVDIVRSGTWSGSRLRARSGWGHWRSSLESGETWRDFRAGWIGLTSPSMTFVKVPSMENGLLSASFNLLPKHRINFRDGLLLGYDEGEFGAGLVYWTKDNPPRYFAIPNVTQLVPWGSGVIALTTTWEDCVAYKIESSPSGELIVEPFKRLPAFFDRCAVQSDGSLDFYGVLRLSSSGVFERIENH